MAALSVLPPSWIRPQPLTKRISGLPVGISISVHGISTLEKSIFLPIRQSTAVGNGQASIMEKNCEDAYTFYQ